MAYRLFQSFQGESFAASSNPFAIARVFVELSHYNSNSFVIPSGPSHIFHHSLRESSLFGFGLERRHSGVSRPRHVMWALEENDVPMISFFFHVRRLGPMTSSICDRAVESIAESSAPDRHQQVRHHCHLRRQLRPREPPQRSS
jgi:hypothetical protein